jgi:hypothetical protein
MSIQSVIYGKDQRNGINLTDEITLKFIHNNILCIPNCVDFNRIKGDPYPHETKKIFIECMISGKNKLYEFEEYRFYDITIDLDEERRTRFTNNNIIIYPHEKYLEDDGGLNVMYTLAKYLKENGKNVKVYPTYGYIKTPIYNEYFVDDFDAENAIVVYCEGTRGNPLNAQYVVRWMLSELGKNVNIDRKETFGKNELVYYFNKELRMENKPEYMGIIIKQLTILYLNPIFRDLQKPRNGKWCYTNRKIDFYHNEFTKYHPEDSFEIMRYRTHEENMLTFNEYTYFISYDPLTFMSFIAAMCGCISIIHPLEGVSKKEWLKMTALKEYMEYKNIDDVYGVAYGIEEKEWAESTRHLVLNQWKDIAEYYKNLHLTDFLRDLEVIDKNFLKNTVENNYYM